MKLKDWMKENRWRCSEFEKICGVDRTSLYYHNNGKRAFGKRRAQRISEATKGEVSILELMFPELDVKILKKRNKKQSDDKKECTSESDETISHERTA